MNDETLCYISFFVQNKDCEYSLEVPRVTNIPKKTPAVTITPSKVLQKALHANPVEPSIPPATIDTLLLNLLMRIPASGAGTKTGDIER